MKKSIKGHKTTITWQPGDAPAQCEVVGVRDGLVKLRFLSGKHVGETFVANRTTSERVMAEARE